MINVRLFKHLKLGFMGLCLMFLLSSFIIPSDAISINGKPIINLTYRKPATNRPSVTFYYDFPTKIDYSSYLIVSPELNQNADVKVMVQDLIVTRPGNTYINPKFINCAPGYTTFDCSVRFTIEVKPKNGTESLYVVKTFPLQQVRNK